MTAHRGKGHTVRRGLSPANRALCEEPPHNSVMNKQKDRAGKSRQAYVPYTVSQDPRERFHTLQLWSRQGTCRGIAYPRILEFGFFARPLEMVYFRV